MARNRFIKSYSNYALKQLHHTTNVGNIVERDWMTISDLNTYSKDSLPTYDLNGFKMLVNDTVSLKKRHQYGSWLMNDDSEYWSLDQMDENSSVSTKQINLKPNFTSITDFVYYGSARKMVESAISYIIRFFPGEAYFTDTKVTINGKDLYIVDNPFDIEFDSLYFTDDKIDNPLRIFSKSYEKYDFILDNGWTMPIKSWSRDIIGDSTCYTGGEELSVINCGIQGGEEKFVKLYYYAYKGKKCLFHDGEYIGASIKPMLKVRNEFFNSLGDFESALLNKKTNYTAYLDTPQETDKGNISYKKAYTWPKSKNGKWNIEINDLRYEEYVESLLEIADFYDLYFTDNLWGSLTHEAIINFDWTFTHESGGQIEELDTPNSKKIEAFLQIAGRNFDDLKRYIDGISYSNAVTYDETNNNPDYFLNDALYNYGWDVKMPIPVSLSKYVTSALYGGHVEGYTVQEANNEFYRRLLLNTRAILASKGTKRAIEMVLSLFGYHSLNFVENAYHEVKDGDTTKMCTWGELKRDKKYEPFIKEIYRNTYDISEYVYVTDENSMAYQDKAIDIIKSVNSLKMTFDDTTDDLQGLPVREVVTNIEVPIMDDILVERDGKKSIEQIQVGTRTEDKSYLIPWFDKDMTYDSGAYFEGKGGWGLNQTKVHEIPEYGKVTIHTNSDLKIYDESVKYLKFIDTMSDLKSIVGTHPKTGDVYYVYDITNQDDYSYAPISAAEAMPTMSHYFILKNEDYDYHLGFVEKDGDDNEIYGWKNISEEELKRGDSADAQHVFYLESIVENNLGNNPHVGYGKYDDGEEYKMQFVELFTPAQNSYEFDGIDDDELQWSVDDKTYTLEDLGFTLNKEVDNVKCWYFADLTDSNVEKILPLKVDTVNNVYTETEETIERDIFMRSYSDQYSRGTDGEQDMFYTKHYKVAEPYNMERAILGEENDEDFNYDEAAANSIINSKALFIEFYPDLKSPDSMYSFINDVALHYAKQVIPSTTLFKYKVPMTGWDVFCYKQTSIQSAMI